MLKILKLSLIWLACMLLIVSCATPAPIPIAASCPQPPPAPQVLLSPPSTEVALIERYKVLIQELRDSLSAAIRQ